MAGPHILIAFHDFNAGGTERIALRLAEAWIAAGVRVTILAGAPDGPSRIFAPPGADIIVLDPPIRRSPTSRLHLGVPMAAQAAAVRPDCIFLPGNFHFSLAAAFKAALPATPIVAKISNPLLPDRSPLTARALRPALRWWTRGIDLFVAMAPSLAEVARRHLPGATIVAIFDPFLSDTDPVEARQGRPVDQDPVRLLSIGRLEPQKNMELGMATVAHLLASGRAVSLTILGDGLERAKLERMAASASLAHAITMVGHVPDTRPYLGEHDMLLMPSLFEGVPAVAGEALRSGMPIAATPCSPWLSQLLADGKLGQTATGLTPQALGAAVEAVSTRAFPSRSALAHAVEPHRIGPASARYLAEITNLMQQTRR